MREKASLSTDSYGLTSVDTGTPAV